MLYADHPERISRLVLEDASGMWWVKDHFGKSTDEVVGEISRILRSGMLRNGGSTKRRRRTSRPAKTATDT